MSSIKVYVGTGLDNADNHQLMRAAFEKVGVNLTFDWVRAGPVEQTLEALRRRAIQDTNGVAMADFVVILLPGNPKTFNSSGRGTHTELGIALGYSIRGGSHVYVISPTTFNDLTDGGIQCVFYYHPRIHRLVATPDQYDDVASAIVKNFRAYNG